MRVLAFGAHPDDMENFCGGTLALLAQQGHEIFVAVATRGDIGSPSRTRDEIAWIRRNEAQTACDLIGATLIWMGFDDEFLFSDRQTRLSFIDAMREAQPDVMFVLSEADYHPDHRTAGTIGRDSRIPASVPLIKTAFRETKIPTTFIMDILSETGEGFIPDFYVDVTSVASVKQEMLAAHVSQIAWMESVFETDMENDAMKRDRRRGAEVGVEFAEAFQLLRDYPITGGTELLPNVILPKG
jgi:LmbE family N-acetylglucosaminyl deacetylase